MAALRGGIRKVLIPKDNEKDLADIPDNVKKGLEIVPVTNVDEVLLHALALPLRPIEWNDELNALSSAQPPRATSAVSSRTDPISSSSIENPRET